MTIATVTGWTYLAAAALASGAGASALTSDSRRRDLAAWRAATVRLLRRHGWSRLKVTFWQDGVLLPGALGPRRQTMDFGINYCLDGRPPQSLK